MVLKVRAVKQDHAFVRLNMNSPKVFNRASLRRVRVPVGPQRRKRGRVACKITPHNQAANSSERRRIFTGESCAAQEEGRLAVTLHGCTPLVLASQRLPRLPRPSASRHAHDPAAANLIQRASSFPLNEARLLILAECRRIETSGRRPCSRPWPRHLPDSPNVDSVGLLPLLAIDRHVSGECAMRRRATDRPTPVSAV